MIEPIDLYADDEFERICKAGDLAADLLAVAARHRTEFVEGIYSLVDTANSEIKKKGDARLLAAAKAVRAAHGAVAKLTPQQKWQLGMIIDDGLRPQDLPYEVWREHVRRPAWLPTWPMRHEVWGNLVPDFIEAMDDAFGELVGRSPHTPSSKRGKPSGTKAQWAMHNFTAKLWMYGNLFGAGHITLSNSGDQAGGSIVALLNILKPVLHKQFFPGILNYSFLRKVQKSLPPAESKRKRLG